MAEEDYSYDWFEHLNAKIKDLEEKQKLMKNRLTLIGENLIEEKEKRNNEITEIKKNIKTLMQNVDRMRNFLESLSEELPKFAKKQDLEILAKQSKMLESIDSEN